MIRRALLGCLLSLPIMTSAQGLSEKPPMAPAVTNYAKQSNTMSTAGAATTPWALFGATTTTVAGAPGGGTWAEVVSSGLQGAIYVSNVTVPATTRVVGSVLTAKVSGSGYAGVVLYFVGSISTCRCWRGDGGACTSTLSAGNTICLAQVSDLTTTPVRLAAIVTLPAAVTTVGEMDFHPGQRDIAVGTARFTAAQLEVNTTRPGLPCVTTTAARVCR